MDRITEQDLPSLVLMVSGLLMSAYGQLAKHTGFVLGGFIFFFMGVLILKPLPEESITEHPHAPLGEDGPATLDE